MHIFSFIWLELYFRYHLVYYHSHSGLRICVGVCVCVGLFSFLIHNIGFFCIHSILTICFISGLLVYLYFPVNKSKSSGNRFEQVSTSSLWGRIAESFWHRTARWPSGITAPSILFLRNHEDAISPHLWQHLALYNFTNAIYVDGCKLLLWFALHFCKH